MARRKKKMPKKKHTTPSMGDGSISEKVIRMLDVIGFRTAEQLEQIADAVTRDDCEIFRVMPGGASRAIARSIFEDLRDFGEADKAIARNAIVNGSQSDLWKRFGGHRSRSHR